MSRSASFDRYRELHWQDANLGCALDVSRIRFGAEGAPTGSDAAEAPDAARRFFATLEPRMQAAFAAMQALEGGAIANADEKRRVGHYWLRAPELAPDAATRAAIEDAVARVDAFAREVHGGDVRPQRAPRFESVVVVGIGGSALGPQFVAHALGGPGDRMQAFFLDNTDPDGFDRTLDRVPDLGRALTIVISKSGGTKETRNGMIEVAQAYRRLGLDFGPHAVAVTGEGSDLAKTAAKEGFLATFPMWDWVGGRTSELSAVGLLPAGLQGLDVAGLLRGAREMDAATRVPRTRANPAALLALAWYSATGGAGKKDMVLLPYKDRLELFSRYLQQLVMESLGKRLGRDGREVNQGIAVYGNKGSTDQHAYVQQLRDGLDNFFVTFVEVLRDRAPARGVVEVDPGVTSGDYLAGFLQGTRTALAERGRESITLTIDQVDAPAIGRLIALYERAVGLYAELVDVNAYHQPGVEAGKKAAEAVLDVQRRIVRVLDEAKTPLGIDDVARAAGTEDRETVYLVLRHLAANPGHRVERRTGPDGDPFAARYARRR